MGYWNICTTMETYTKALREKKLETIQNLVTILPQRLRGFCGAEFHEIPCCTDLTPTQKEIMVSFENLWKSRKLGNHCGARIWKDLRRRGRRCVLKSIGDQHLRAVSVLPKPPVWRSAFFRRGGHYHPTDGEAQEITETMKAADQMTWSGKMNNIRAGAMEVVDKEIIYA